MKNVMYVIIGFITVILCGVFALVVVPVFIAGGIAFILVTFVGACIASAVIIFTERIKCKTGHHDIEDDDIVYKDGERYAFCQNCAHWVRYDYMSKKWIKCEEGPNGGVHNGRD